MALTLPAFHEQGRGEHFVRYAHGVLIESPQLRQWAFLGGVVGFFVLAAR